MDTVKLTSKPHYEILDGLRGVAAFIVVAFHLFEAHATSSLDQILNHGYLAVDFFYVLSGFVIGYAYDDRWGRMSLGDFARRRLIRLHPMVVAGSFVGALFFYFQGCPEWPGIPSVPLWKVIGIMLIGMTLLPVPLSMDIRGWQEMHPLNGPQWSLFYEYIANALYALFFRRVKKWVLALFVALFACATLHLTLTSPQGDIIGGWSLDKQQLTIGFTRLLYPFFAGLLLFRVSKLRHIKHAFPLCSLLVIVFLCLPRIGGADGLWKNGLYDALVIILVFPFIVYLGACGEVKGKYAPRICKFFGDLSYPLYITHYPLIYTYTAWVNRTPNAPLSASIGYALLTFAASVFF
ncbi:MAG: acyltransferase, partial [Tannerella sp.]|nr:acyltransferase [Tannerella sp.]